jgi:enoyl-CoA hydratase/carnithine racemase
MNRDDANPAISGELLLRNDSESITTLTLNRPRESNALSFSLLTEFDTALDEIANDTASRVVVIGAAGRAFCAGHDLKEMRANREREFLRSLFDLCTRVFTKLTLLPQPVIAKVQGIATAGGCQMVAACDLAVASTEAKFATSGINVGLFCSTPGVALSRNAPRKRAMEMLLTGDLISAETAAQWGLVNIVVSPGELEQETLRLARAICAKPREIIAEGKRAFYEQIDKPLHDAYGIACRTLIENVLTADAAEGLDAFHERRAPRWQA